MSLDQFKSKIQIMKWIVPMVCDPHGTRSLQHPWNGLRLETLQGELVPQRQDRVRDQDDLVVAKPAIHLCGRIFAAQKRKKLPRENWRHLWRPEQSITRGIRARAKYGELSAMSMHHWLGDLVVADKRSPDRCNFSMALDQ
jgi:hypothetical protein